MAKESNLTKVLTLGNTDEIRVIVGGASRSIIKTNFITTITQLLIDAGFLNSASSSINNRFIQTFAADRTAVTTDDVLLMDATAASRTVFLPLAASFYNSTDNKSNSLTIKKIDASAGNTVTIDPNGSELIDGVATAVLSTAARPFVTVVTDGVQWWSI